MPFSDSTLGHVGASGFFGGFEASFGKITGHYLITENGKTIAAGNPLQGAVGPCGEFHTTVTLSPRPATIRFVLDATRKAKIYTLSTSSRTVWTWRSAAPERRPAPGRVGLRLTRRGTVAGPLLRGGADDDAGVRGGRGVAVRVRPAGAQAMHVIRGPFAAGRAVAGDGGDRCRCRSMAGRPGTRRR